MSNSSTLFAKDLEEAVLGALLIDGKSASSVLEIINDKYDVFFDKKNKTIYKCIFELLNEGSEVDLLLVSQKLTEKDLLKECGGDFYLIQMTQKVGSSAHVSQHCHVLLQYYFLRKVRTIGKKYMEVSVEDNVFDVLEGVEKDVNTLDGIVNYHQSKDLKFYNDELIKLGFGKREVIMPKLSSLANLIGGYMPCDDIVVAGRPGMGKTAYVISDIVHLCTNGVAVAFYSLEMTAVQVLARIYSNLTGIPAQKFRTGDMSSEDYKKLSFAREKVEKWKLIIDETCGITPAQLRRKVEVAKAKIGVKVVFIDYIGLMTCKGLNREQEISNISRSIKIIAKDFSITCVTLSQLSRKVDDRKENGRRPVISDLRDSGSVEQDADVVLFLYNEDYYERIERGVSAAEVIIGKNRNGASGLFIPCIFDKVKNSFYEEDNYSFKSPKNFYEVEDENTPF